MSERDKHRADKDEERDAFDGERHGLRPVEKDDEDERPQDEWSVDEDQVHVEDGNIVENDVGNVIARFFGGVDAGVEVDDETRQK